MLVSHQLLQHNGDPLSVLPSEVIEHLAFWVIARWTMEDLGHDDKAEALEASEVLPFYVYLCSTMTPAHPAHNVRR